MHQKAIPFKRGNTIELSMWFGIAPGSGIDSLIGVKPVCRLRPRHAREAVAVSTRSRAKAAGPSR